MMPKPISETPATGAEPETGAMESTVSEPPALPGAETNQKKAGAGSYSFDDDDRPLWEKDTVLEREFEYSHPDGSYAYSVFKGRRTDGQKTFLSGRQFKGGMGDLDLARRDDPRAFYRFQGLETVMKGAGDHPDLLYGQYELDRSLATRPADPVFICEGEKDADTLRGLGLIATTNPNGALKWNPRYNAQFADRDVFVMVDNDPNGEKRDDLLTRSLSGVAKSVRAVRLPGLRLHGDVTDWLNENRTLEDLLAALEQSAASGRGVRLEDFRAFMPSHNYIFVPSGEMWPSTSVNSRIPPVPLINGEGEPVLDGEGEPRRLPANQWLDQNSPVEQMTWAPGEPQVIPDRLIAEGGWFPRPGCNVFNQYRPPAPSRGEADQAGPWIEHVHRVYPGDARHLLDWLAHRVQRPEQKINHAIVMGGAQGIGKDTILEPVKAAIGHWNFVEVSPQHMLGRFNGFVKSVILRVSEARDLGDLDRFAFYDHMKTYTAAPPDVLRVDEKFMREYSVFNVCGVIITSNHKTNGLYLPEDDRRHFVAWSELGKDDFSQDYWQRLWSWYARGGTGHVAAYLAQRDISSFEAKAPPPKTEAFWDIVASNSAPEDAELSDALEKLGNPDAVTLMAIADAAESSFASWLRDRANARRVPHKMEECGYKSVRNPTAKSGRWKVGGKDMVVYARKELSIRDAITAAEKRAAEGINVPF
jgi:hypothetical protein